MGDLLLVFLPEAREDFTAVLPQYAQQVPQMVQ